ncbi:MAG: hypothetical protein RID07_04705 [Lacipirellulaceae bacterium]
MNPQPLEINAHTKNFGSKATDVQLRGAELYFLPVKTRVPLKFGTETLTSVTCARVQVEVADQHGNTATGWGEVPLSVQWVCRVR